MKLLSKLDLLTDFLGIQDTWCKTLDDKVSCNVVTRNYVCGRKPFLTRLEKLKNSWYMSYVKKVGPVEKRVSRTDLQKGM